MFSETPYHEENINGKSSTNSVDDSRERINLLFQKNNKKEKGEADE
jgi:hypothetical protein